MEMNLQPLAMTCYVSGEPFVDGARVASYLVRATTLEVVRYDLIEQHVAGFAVHHRLLQRRPRPRATMPRRTWVVPPWMV